MRLTFLLLSVTDSSQIIMPNKKIDLAKRRSSATSVPKKKEPFWEVAPSGVCEVPERDNDGQPIVALPNQAFVRCVNLVTVTLPPSIKAIGNLAFAGCSSLKSVALPDGLKVIGISAFAGTSKLTKLHLPASLTALGSKAFQGCGVTSVTLPAGLEDLEAGTFANCTSLVSFDVDSPASSKLRSIRNRAFAGCTNLVAVSLPPCITLIGNGVFHGCHSLHDAAAKLPAGIEVLGHGVFAHCPEVTAIGLPPGLESFNIRTLQPLLMPPPAPKTDVRMSSRRKGGNSRWATARAGTSSLTPGGAKPTAAPASPGPSSPGSTWRKARAAVAITSPGRPSSARDHREVSPTAPSLRRIGRPVEQSPSRATTPQRLVAPQRIIASAQPSNLRQPAPTIVVPPRPSVAFEECRAELRQLARQALRTQASNVGTPHVFKGIF